MVRPVLVIMAAGMGSRYGGLKQMDPVGPGGELILDYSLYDAWRAGFRRAVIVIKRENERDFREVMGGRLSGRMDIELAYQDMDDLPAGFSVPEGRVKPWGTGHAVLAARGLVDAPFCAINADDYYGAEAFALCYDHLSNLGGDGDIAMAGYLLKNTLSESGYVARGVCELGEGSALTGLIERTHIISTVDGPLMTEDCEHYTRLSPDAVVSMNMWSFPLGFMRRLEESFPRFLSDILPQNPLKAEFFLPMAVNGELEAGRAAVTVRISRDRWYGVTYKNDRPVVTEALASFAREGKYPMPLWK